MNGFYLSTNIKYLRTLKNISQNKLSKVIGKTASAIANYESGIREPSAIDLGKLANYFCVSVDDLVTKDLRFEDKSNQIKEELGNETLIVPKDIGKWKKGDSVSVNEFMDYVEDIKKKNDKLQKVFDMLKEDE